MYKTLRPTYISTYIQIHTVSVCKHSSHTVTLVSAFSRHYYYYRNRSCLLHLFISIVILLTADCRILAQHRKGGFTDCFHSFDNVVSSQSAPGFSDKGPDKRKPRAPARKQKNFSL